jgi:hypothetical protein
VAAAPSPRERQQPGEVRIAILQPWVDFDFGPRHPVRRSGFPTRHPAGALTAEEWAHLRVTGAIWLLIPLGVGLALLTRAEATEATCPASARHDVAREGKDLLLAGHQVVQICDAV